MRSWFRNAMEEELTRKAMGTGIEQAQMVRNNETEIRETRYYHDIIGGGLSVTALARMCVSMFVLTDHLP